MTVLNWTPRDGDTIHLRGDNHFQLPAGRYRLTKGAGEYWHLHGVTNGQHVTGIRPNHLAAQEAAQVLTPISEAEIERERQEVGLRLVAPLRGARHRPMLPQHDASELALFRAANEPELGL